MKSVFQCSTKHNNLLRSHTLIGGTGDDSLDGGLGINTLIGATGNDIYFIDNTTDTVTEYFNQGTDSVISSSKTYTLSANLENLELSSYSSAESGTGNSLDNNIFGNNNNNYLYGSDGNDTLDDLDSVFPGTQETYQIVGELESSNDYFDGGAGNDTLNARGGNDSLYGGPGDDFLTDGDGTVLYSDNANDYLAGGDGNDSLYGGSGDTVIGGNDNDYLYGGGALTLTGGAGIDKFFFSSPIIEIATITDFSIVDDTITVNVDPDPLYGFGGGLTVGAAITTNQFVLGSAAGDTSDRFIYNQNTGALFFDSDGTGENGQVQFATLTNKPPLTNADIFVTG